MGNYFTHRVNLRNAYKNALEKHGISTLYPGGSIVGLTPLLDDLMFVSADALVADDLSLEPVADDLSLEPESRYIKTTTFSSVTYRVPKNKLCDLLGINVPEGAEIRILGLAGEVVIHVDVKEESRSTSE